MSTTPTKRCHLAGLHRDEEGEEIPCDPTIHSMTTYKLPRLCSVCKQARDERLATIKTLQVGVAIPQWKWNVSYVLDENGSDHWSRKVNEQKSAAQAEENTKAKSKRWSQILEVVKVVRSKSSVK